MTKIFVSTFLIAFSTALFAQSDAKSADIINDVVNKTQSYKSIKISFDYNVGTNKQKGLTYNGTIWYKNGKYKLNVAEQDIISDGKSTWIYLKEAKEVQINDVSDNEDVITPVKLIDGSFAKNFRSKFMNEKANLQTIELVPAKTGKAYSKITLIVDKAKKQIKKATIYDKSGNVLTYSIKVFLDNPPIDDKVFVFNPKNYPGVEINDMR